MFSSRPRWFSKVEGKNRKVRRAGRRWARPRLEALEDRTLLSIHIQFDYTHDTNGFFTQRPEAKATLQYAADLLTSRLSTFTPLQAIQPNSAAGNTWTAKFYDPADMNQTKSIDNLYVPEDTLIIYVGGSNLPAGGELGRGGPGGAGATGDQGFVDTVQSRGQTGFATWGGSISFGMSLVADGYFGTSPSVTPGEYDFFSIATHELGHVLGIGDSQQWSNDVRGTNFIGAYAESVFGGPVPLDQTETDPADRDAHWAEQDSSITPQGAWQQAKMTPSQDRGTRDYFTLLDYAGLQDLGWQFLDTVTVHGRVIDAATGAGLHTVILSQGPGDQELFRAFTDANGYYSGQATYDFLPYIAQDSYNGLFSGNAHLYLIPTLNDTYAFGTQIQLDFLNAPVFSITDSPPTPQVPDPQPDGSLYIVGPSGNDQFVVSRQGNNLAISINGQTNLYPYSSVTYLNIEGSGGADSLKVDSSGGTAIPTGGISFDTDDEGENNTLVVKGGFSQGQYQDQGDGSGSLIFGGGYFISFGGVGTLQAPVPIFNNPNIPVTVPLTLLVGQPLNLDLSAKDGDGDPVSYYFNTVGSKGIGWSGNSSTGLYSFTPTAGQEGTYTVTATADGGSNLDTATVSFQIVVLPGPSIGFLTSDKTSITQNDSSLITFTANNVTTPSGSVGGVLFQYEINNDGVLHSLPNATQVAGTNNWVLQTPLVISSLGTVTVYASASSGGAIGPSQQVTLQIGPGTTPPSLISPVANSLYTSPGGQVLGWTGYDQSNNLSFVYFDLSSSQLYLKRFDPTGKEIGSPTALSPVQGDLVNGKINVWDVAFLPGGGFVVLWDNTSTLMVNEFNADGSPYNSLTYPIDSSGPFTQPPRIAISSPGQFAVVVPHGAFGSQQVYYYRYTAEGERGFQTLDNGNYVGAVDVAMDSLGDSVVVWGSSQVGPGAGAQRLDVNGNPVGGIIPINTLKQTDAYDAIGNGGDIRVAADENGNFVCVWSQVAEGSGGLGTYTGTIYARRFRADGTPLDAGEFKVNDVQAGESRRPVVAVRAGKLLITWTDAIDYQYFLYGQAYSWSNTLLPLGGNFTVLANANNVSALTAAAIDSQGDSSTLSWTQVGNENGNTYFQQFTGLSSSPGGFGLLYDPATTGDSGSVVSFADDLPIGSSVGFFQSQQQGNWMYTLVPGQGGDDNGDFQIVNGELATNTTFNVNSQSNFSIRVRATPSAGLAQEEMFNLTATGTFGDGYVVTNFNPLAPGLDYASAAVVQLDGKVVVVGNNTGGNTMTALARYNIDGSLDPSFGGTGLIVSRLLPGYNFAEGVALQSDGKIVVVGTGDNLTANVIYLARYNTDGTLDTTFGVGGIVISPFTAGGQLDAAVAVQSDGMIVVACETQTASGPGPVVVLRYNASGILDTTFGVDGFATLAPAASYQNGLSLVIDPSGNIIVAGDTSSGGKDKLFVERLLPNGMPDTSFNGNGYQIIALPSTGIVFGYSMALQPDGKILVAGDYGILRLNSDGSMDTTWGGTGLLSTPLGSTPVVPLTSVLVEPDNKVLAVGGAKGATNNDFVFIRYLPNGTVDLEQQMNLGGDDYAQAITLSRDGRVVVAGNSSRDKGTVQDFALWQIDANGPPTATVSGPTTAATGQLVVANLGALSPSLTVEASPFTYQINWGDNTPTQYTTALNSVSLGHIYSAAGMYQVQVTATDAGNRSSAPMTHTIAVTQSPLPPSITGNPSSQTVTAGQTATFTASATGIPTPSVQWQFSTDGGHSFRNLSGATSTTLTLSNVSTAMNGYEYEAVFTNSAGSHATSAAALTVHAPQSPPPPPLSPPPAPPPPPTLELPPLLAFFDSLLGGMETMNTNGTETITDRFFGFPLLVSTFDHTGKLVSVDLLGSIDITFLFG